MSIIIPTQQLFANYLVRASVESVAILVEATKKNIINPAGETPIQTRTRDVTDMQSLEKRQLRSGTPGSSTQTHIIGSHRLDRDHTKQHQSIETGQGTVTT